VLLHLSRRLLTVAIVLALIVPEPGDI